MRAVALGLALFTAWAAAALEVAHPAFFASEPVAVWAAWEDPPTLSWSGEPFPVRWERERVGERFRFLVTLPKDALGVWIVCAKDGPCSAFLRIPDHLSLLEVQGIPGSVLTLGTEIRVADKSGFTFFAVLPGSYLLNAEQAGIAVTRAVDLQPGRRVLLTLALAQAETSSSLALPGHVVTLTVRVMPPRDLPWLRTEVALPMGWTAEPNPGLLDPLPAGVLSLRSWRVAVPADAPYGEHRLEVDLPDLGLRVHASLTVAARLPPRIVVGHWDTKADRLDLARPFALTFERLLWAAAFVGRELPYTGRVFTKAHLEELAREWERTP